MTTLGRVLGIAATLIFVSACGGGSGGSGGSGGGTQPPTSFTVSTSTVGTGSGALSPTSRSVSHGSTTSFTVSPVAGSSIASVSGCGGSLSGSTYMTGAISSGCTVTATFDLSAYTVTATAGSGGSISPGSASVSHGSTTSFTVTPSDGFQINSVSGCSGSQSGSTYTTGPVTAACTVSATFELDVENRVSVVNGEFSLAVPRGFVVREYYDDPSNYQVFISEPETLDDDIHGNTALRAKIYRLSDRPNLGATATVYDLVRYLVAHVSDPKIETKDIGGGQFVVAYDEAVQRTIYATALDADRVVTFGGGTLGAGSLSDEEIEAILASLHFDDR